MATSYRPENDDTRDEQVQNPDNNEAPRTNAPTSSERSTGAGDVAATRPIPASVDTRSGPGRDEQLRAEATETRRAAAVELGIARTRNRASTDIGLLVLRVLNVVMFLHGLAKVTGYSGFRETVANNSLGALAPDLFAILVVAGQLALPIAIALGLLTRISGLLQAVMMGVIWVLFPLAGGLRSAETGGLNGESAFLFVAIGLTLFFTGAGRFSIDHVLFGRRAEARAERRAEKKLA